MAFRWRPSILLRIADVSQAVLCIVLALVGTAQGEVGVAAGFAAAGLCFLFTSAGVRGRALSATGSILTAGTLAYLTVARGAPLSFLLVLGGAAIAVALMHRAANPRPAGAAM